MNTPPRRFSGGIRLLALTILLLPLRAAEPAPAALPDSWWKDAVFYEVFVRSFADSSRGPLANDGIGDLQGLVEHLDYLNDGNPDSSASLGVNALWLMPVNPSPSYHGYDVTDYFAVNPQYGDLAAMRRLIDEAHRRGIRVIVDLVLNHASSRHPLFERACAKKDDSAARACFRFAALPRELSGPGDQRVWHPCGREFYYGLFSAEMPDWNFRSPETTAHHRRVAEFWLKDVGVDGFRLDAIRYFFEDPSALQDTAETKVWLRDFTAYCHALKPGCFLVGECSGPTPIIAAYDRARAQDSLFEFGLSRALFEAIHFEQPGILRAKFDELAREYEGRQTWSVFLANHDQERTLSQFDGDDTLARLAAELEFVLPGTPFVYYGEEIGMTGRKPDEELRTPLPWNGRLPNGGFTREPGVPWHALHPDAVVHNVEDEARVSDSLLALYRRLIRLRLSQPTLRTGTLHPIAVSSDRVFACLREKEGDWILVLANLGAETVPEAAVRMEDLPAADGFVFEELLQQAVVRPPPAGTARTGKTWAPLPVLAPHAVYVIRRRASS